VKAAAAAVALLALLRAAPAQAEEIDRSGFRHERELHGIHGGPVLLEPDGALFAGSRPGLGDLRVLDADGAEVPWRHAPSGFDSPPIRRRPRVLLRRESASRTSITFDLGFRDLPVDELRVQSATARYNRPVHVSASSDGRRFRPVASADIDRFGNSRKAAVPVSTRARYLRVTIENGDDPPLRRIEVTAVSHRRALLLEGGHPGPYVLLYGDPLLDAPSYDLAHLPLDDPAIRASAEEGRLGPVRPNTAFVPPAPPVDDRSFLARHEEIVTGSLVLAAFALGGAGLLALRRPGNGGDDGRPRRQTG
jgi:hypothetical protein